MQAKLLVIISVVLMSFLAFSCSKKKVCRCMIESNAVDQSENSAPNPLYDIIYIKEKEECEDYDDVQINYGVDKDPQDTVVNYIQITTTCRDRMDSFPPDED
ncbi:MAG: hypothetical protein JJU02_07300 [Cryomorphaceae bacterium]|nr:hypothetical protein [Cryomorphaceae bacterium]